MVRTDFFMAGKFKKEEKKIKFLSISAEIKATKKAFKSHTVVQNYHTAVSQKYSCDTYSHSCSYFLLQLYKGFFFVFFAF